MRNPEIYASFSFLQSDISGLLKMKLISHLTLTLTLASALDATASKRNRSLAIDVTLSRLGNTTIAANITSNADLPLKLIKYGNILDDSPYFSKVNVNSSSTFCFIHGKLFRFL
jgi:hypothetical protein